MYKKISKLILVAGMFLSLLFPLNIYGDEYSINDLIESGKELDKSNITISGEAIGEALGRGDYTWLNINDTTNAIGVYMSTDDANKVKTYGGFNEKGDIIEVKGIFNRACKEHGGDMDIHASKVIIKEEGKQIVNNIDFNKIFLLLISSAILLVVAMLYYLKVKK